MQSAHGADHSGDLALTNIHGSISVCGAAHIAGTGAKQALCFIKAEHSISGTRLLEQGIDVLWSVADPLGHQASAVHHLHSDIALTCIAKVALVFKLIMIDKHHQVQSLNR